MRGDAVVAFHESLGRHLPVRLDHLMNVHDDMAVLPVVALEMFGDRADVVHQRLGVGIEVDEHEAAPGVDPGLRQAHVLALPLREIPADRVVLERAVVVPGDAVIRAAELVPAAVQGHQLAATMQAGIVEGLDRHVRRADDDQRLADILVDPVVADVGDLLLAARPLPDLRPQVFDFLGEVAGVVVALDRNGVRALVPAWMLPQMIRRTLGIALQDVLVAL